MSKRAYLRLLDSMLSKPLHSVAIWCILCAIKTYVILVFYILQRMRKLNSQIHSKAYGQLLKPSNFLAQQHSRLILRLASKQPSKQKTAKTVIFNGKPFMKRQAKLSSFMNHFGYIHAPKLKFYQASGLYAAVATAAMSVAFA